MNNRDLVENWRFKEEKEEARRKQGVRRGEMEKDDVDQKINFDLEKGGEITEPYCKELFSAILAGAAIGLEDDIATVSKKLREGLKLFHSSSIHPVSFFGDISRDRIQVRVIDPRVGRGEGALSLPVFLTHKGKKVLLFFNFNKESLENYLGL